jgi:hypothetical protein
VWHCRWLPGGGFGLSYVLARIPKGYETRNKGLSPWKLNRTFTLLASIPMTGRKEVGFDTSSLVSVSSCYGGELNTMTP